MNRYAIENLFGIEGLNIAWYGLIIACGMVLGFALAIYRCRKTGINKEHIYDLALWLIPVCIICARAYYVIFEWDNYKNDLLSVFEINRGGLAIYGGVLGGVAVALIYCKVKRISFWSLADTLMPSLVLGQAIGRWGNFVNQEAYGNQITNPSLCFFPYGVYIEEIDQWRQATFFYESALNLALLTAMLPAFQAKRLSSSVLYDRVRNDTFFCGGAALRQPLSPSGYPCITGAVRLPDYSRYRYTFYYP